MPVINKINMWINRSLNRLIDSANDVIVRNTAEPLIGFHAEATGSQPPSRAEETDFLSINEWMNPYYGEPSKEN
jgi:hypothetical protein